MHSQLVKLQHESNFSSNRRTEHTFLNSFNVLFEQTTRVGKTHLVLGLLDFTVSITMFLPKTTRSDTSEEAGRVN
jgi:hypothetical protein